MARLGGKSQSKIWGAVLLFLTGGAGIQRSVICQGQDSLCDKTQGCVELGRLVRGVGCENQ